MEYKKNIHLKVLIINAKGSIENVYASLVMANGTIENVFKLEITFHFLD